MTARRIGRPDGSPPRYLVTFTFDGHDVQGVEGEPLAVALLAAGQPVISRSFRFHRPRGLMCSTGQCGWCECEVDGVPSVRSCRVPVREGLAARGEHAWPSVEHDALSALGAFSRWIPPTFYHHRFLRPRSLRKRYLDVIRGFGGRGTLRVGGANVRPRVRAEARSGAVIGRPTRSLETDVLVVGGGRAGLDAAAGAAGAGATVVLIEADRAGRRPELEVAARAAGVDLRPGTTAIGWYDGVVAAITGEEHLEIAARAVIAATGSYERVPLVSGADRPGVLGARTVLELIERDGVLPGERALLVGDGPDVVAAGDALRRCSAEVVGPIPTASLVAIRGRMTVDGADVRIDGRREHHAVDLVAFGDRSPNLDLVLAAGGAVRSVDGTLVPVADEHGRTTVAKLFVAGSAAGPSAADGDRAETARATGRAAARVATGARRRTARRDVTPVPVEGGPAQGPHVARGAIVCFCEDVRAWEIRAEQAHGYREPELIKRRTGALTGPCQGKQCLQAFASLTAPSDNTETQSLPTARPPLRPVRLGDLAARVPDDGPTGA